MLRAMLVAAFAAGFLTAPVAAKDKRSPAFQVAITLSAAAKEKVVGAGERITISAMFEGMPKPGVETEGGGPVYLGDETQELEGEGRAKFAGVTLDPKGLKQMQGAPEMLINVYTSRRVFENNLLHCDLFQGPFDAIPDEPIAINCKLIEE